MEIEADIENLLPVITESFKEVLKFESSNKKIHHRKKDATMILALC